MALKVKVKVFFFDFDGVLVDSERTHMQAAQIVAQNFEITFTEEDYFRDLLGFDDIGLFQFLWKKNNRTLERNELFHLIESKNHEFTRMMKTNAPFFEGAIELIDKFKKAGTRLAVVSGALKSEIVMILNQKNLLSEFDFIVAADDVEVSKPDPECYQRAFAQMKQIIPTLKLDDCLTIEDSPAGVEAALGAGISAIGITNSVSEKYLYQAKHIISHLNEIEVTPK